MKSGQRYMRMWQKSKRWIWNTVIYTQLGDGVVREPVACCGDFRLVVDPVEFRRSRKVILVPAPWPANYWNKTARVGDSGARSSTPDGEAERPLSLLAVFLAARRGDRGVS